ncbi:MAG: hypothetical protein PUB21_04740 [Bacteroidales bacterium]|nr:hypothetical protein [Bacteroidales bacterium]
MLTLLIDNKSQDTVYIRNFNKCIFNKFNHIEEGRAFSWELLTLSDQLPEEIVLVLPHNKKLKLPEKNTDIVVLPNSLYVTEIEIKQSSVSYPAEGYYKLCLYYEALKECVAELVVWND